jgi:hypothetical protein
LFAYVQMFPGNLRADSNMLVHVCDSESDAKKTMTII